MAKILAVDDEPSILSLIKTGLEKDGHYVTVSDSAEQIPSQSLNYYDLILLDVMMPDLSGFEYIRQIRGITDAPILFLTAKTQEEDILYGLGLGADDYLEKPFRIAELRARVAAHLRRESREHHSVMSLGDYRFDLSGKTLAASGVIIAFTKGEYAICEFLARRRGQVFSKEQIYETVFGFDAEGDSSSISTHIKNIRAKLGADCPLKTSWGVGYLWE